MEEKVLNFDTIKNIKNLKFFKSIIILIVSIGLLILIFNMFFFVVDEREQAVVTQFNKVTKVVVDSVDDEMRDLISNNSKIENTKILQRKGLHFKIPFVQTVNTFTDMLLTYDTSPREVISLDQKKLVLDNFAQWKIQNPALFFITLKNETSAHTRLDDIIYSKLNEEIGKANAIQIIADKDYVSQMLDDMTLTINEQLKPFGIEVVDIRIKKTELPAENYANIFNRMKTERERAAKEYRSKGYEEAQKIRSQADKEATIIEANAYEKAEQIKGEGDAEAIRIYAEAYNKDPDFFAFWRSLQAYKKVFDGKTKIVLDKDSEFVKYFYEIEMPNEIE